MPARLSFSRSILIPMVLGAVALSMTPRANATDASLFVQQVQSLQPANNVALSSEGSAVERISAHQLDVLLPPLPQNRSNSSAQVQAGNRNVAAAVIAGGRNATLQVQIGNNLDSTIGIAGSRNRVAVDQRGVGLESDIEITGKNKAVLHIQRGHGSNPEHQPLTFEGSSREAVIVLDTPRGRLTKTVNP